MNAAPTYGLLAEFSSSEELLQAVLRTRTESPGASVEAYSPFRIEGLDAALGATRSPIPALMGLGGLLAGLGTFALEAYSAIVDYPIDVGGRPLGSWPAFVPPAAEMAVLGAVLFGVIAMLTGNALPRLHHPLFDVPAFERASADGFFLLLRGPDGDTEGARSFLQRLSPVAIYEVHS
jgi:hypothetical protein